jgi:hypothetical protein
MHRAFRADRSSGSELHEMQLFRVERTALANSLPKRFNRGDELRMFPRQAEIEARFVGHVRTYA